MAKFLNLIKAMGFGTAADAAVQTGLSTDTQPRLQIDAGGRHTWGAGGTSAGDTNLYRSAADTLRTDDAFIAAGGLTVKTIEIDPASATAGQVLSYNGTKFVPTNATGGSSITVSDTAPTSPTQGDMWFESDTGITFIYYDSTWVEISTSGPIGPAGPQGPTGPEGGTSTLTTKGDLLTRSSSALSRLGVGTDRQLLVADSTTATGLVWTDKPWNTAWGIQLYESTTASQLFDNDTAKTLLTATFTVIPNRRYCITGRLAYQPLGPADGPNALYVTSSGFTTKTLWYKTSATPQYLIDTAFGVHYCQASDFGVTTGTGTNKTINLVFYCGTSGTTNPNPDNIVGASSFPIQLMVEDIGPA